MDTEFKNMVVGRYETLPERLQSLIVKPEVSALIQIIGDKHHLPADKSLLLADIVMLTLLTFEGLGTFEERLVEELLIPGSVAESITRDIESAIFTEVKMDLDQLWEERELHEKELGLQKPAKDSYKPSGKEPLAEPLPSYKKPLTEIPTYKEDPYREIPQ